MITLPPLASFSALISITPPEWYDLGLDSQLSKPAHLHTILTEAEFLKDKNLKSTELHAYSRRWMRLATQSGLLTVLADLATASQPRPIGSKTPKYYRYENNGMKFDWTPPSRLQKLFGQSGYFQVVTFENGHVRLQLDTNIRYMKPGPWIVIALSAAKAVRPQMVLPPACPPHY